MKRGVDGPDGKEMTSSSHLEMGHPVYTLGTGAGIDKFNKKNQTFIFDQKKDFSAVYYLYF